MHFRGLDLNLLFALDALLKEKNVTRAAERVLISQPAMSGALNKLRYHFDDPLLERQGRGLELTHKAKALREPLTEFMVLAERMLNHTPTFEPATDARIFTIAMSGYCAEIFGVPLVRRILKCSENVSIQIIDLTIESLVAVKEGQIDFCITVEEGSMSDGPKGYEGLESVNVYNDEFVLVSAAKNKAIKGAVGYAGFCKLPYVETRFGNGLISIVEHSLRRNKERPVTRACVPSFLKALAMLSDTSMVTIAPSRLYETYKSVFGLGATNVPFKLPSLKETLFWHPRNENDPSHVWMREIMLEVAGEL